MLIIEFLKKAIFFFFLMRVIKLSYLTMPGTTTLQYSEWTSDFFRPWFSSCHMVKLFKIYLSCFYFLEKKNKMQFPIVGENNPLNYSGKKHIVNFALA